MSTKTFTERCHIAQQLLPDAQYRAMLTNLHTEMLAALAEQPAPVQVPFLVRLYNEGYRAGHHDTVESCYTHVLPQDLDTYHSDVVAEWLAENPQAQPTQTAGKSELETVPAKGGLLAEQPAQRKPLTDEQIRDIHWSKPMDEYAFARAIEAAHNIKVNT